ncbi:hypothetical protein V8E36_005027 [Tilletia maclaganii]
MQLTAIFVASVLVAYTSASGLVPVPAKMHEQGRGAAAAAAHHHQHRPTVHHPVGKHTGAAATGRAHHHHKKAPPVRKQGLPANASDIVTVPLEYTYDQTFGSAWLASVQAGKSTFKVALDAQYTDLIVNAGVYQPQISPSSKKDNIHFKVERDSDEIAVGDQYTDTFKIGSLNLKQFPIGFANSKWIKRAGVDALLGFAYNWPSEMNSKNVPFLWALKDAGAISRAVMGLALWKQGGSVSLGGVDLSKFKGGVQWVGIPDGWPFWSAEVAKIGGVDTILTLDSTRWAINCPRDVAEKIFKSDPAYKTWEEYEDVIRASVDCKNPPKITVEFGPVKGLVGGMTDFKHPDGRCVVPLVGVSKEALPSGDCLLGAAGLANLYTVVDMEKGVVGYAARA